MKRIIPLFLASAILLTGCGSSTQQNGTKDATQNVQTNKNIFIMAGKIEANTKADITSKISARVLSITVDVGSTVKKGDLIIKLDTKDLQAQVEQSEAAVNTAVANLAKAKKGARLEQIAQANSTVNSTKTSYENAKTNYNRLNELYQNDAISKQQLEASKVLLQTSESAYDSAKDQLDMLKKGETNETLSVLESQVKQALSALEVSKAQLSNSTIIAPISGVVSARKINVGELASTSTSLISIVNTDTLYINAYLPAGLIGTVKVGQKTIIKISELPDKEFSGEIDVINPVIDSNGKNILVKVKLENSNSDLKPGMFAEIGVKD